MMNGAAIAPIDRLRRQLNTALLGKADVIERVIACLLAGGHLLLEDKPGLGKTTLAKALAQAIGGTFSRVQCTPDLLPGDITGFSVFNLKTREFEFQAGPVFADVLLTDEINRTTPRTQSALLEAMAERQATVDNIRHPLSTVFFVIATQNPIEHHGTYPLPEAQLDRFAMKLSIGYPDKSSQHSMLAAAVACEADAGNRAAPCFSTGELRAIQDRVAVQVVAANVQSYLIDLGEAIRNHPRVTLGLSPRGLLIWQRAGQAWSFLQGRPFVTPDDLRTVAGPVLNVRLGVQGESEAVIRDVLNSVTVPIYPN